MRKQYHFKPSPGGFYAWDVDLLVDKSSGLLPFDLNVEDISELDEPYWYGNGTIPSCRSIVAHMKLIAEVSLDYPIILSAEGTVMDGMHRVGKALLEGKRVVKAVQFEKTPDPDFVDVNPDKLPY